MRKLVLLVLLVLLVPIVNAITFKTLYNPFTGKLDYYSIPSGVDNITINNLNASGQSTFNGVSLFNNDVLFFDNVTFVGGSVINGTLVVNDLSSVPILYINASKSSNVGIGTTNPSNKLEVSGNMSVTGNTLLATSSGNVGIGTTSPQRKLTVTNTGANGQLLLEDTAATSGQHYGVLGFSRGQFNFDILNDAYASTSRMVIDNQGNVGIGTTGPLSPLSVDGAAYATSESFVTNKGIVQISSLGTDVGLSIGNYNAAPSYAMFLQNTDPRAGIGLGNYAIVLNPVGGNVGVGYTDPGTAKLAINGNVGIGTTTPSVKLDVAGSGYISSNLFVGGAITGTSTLNVTGLTTLGNATTSSLTVTGGAYLATITGNVGIGTTNPTSKLEVIGSGNFTGNITFGTKTNPINITGFRPDGTRVWCGVDNSNVWSCVST